MIFSPTFSQFWRLRSPLNVRAITLCLCAFCVFATSFVSLDVPAFAQVSQKSAVKSGSAASKSNDLSEISKFINENTLMVARVDLERIDYDKFGETLENLFKILATKLDFDEESTSACLVEFHKTVEALKETLKEGLASDVKKYGATRLYFVLQSTKGEGACFIVPAEGLSDDQIEQIKLSMSQNGKSLVNCALYQKTHILSSTIPLKELGAYYKKFVPAANPKLEKFFSSHADKAVAFYCGRVKIRPLVAAQMPSVDDFVEDEEEAQAIKAANASAKVSATHGTGRVQVAEGEARIAFLQGGVFGKLSKNRKVDDPFEDSPRCVKDLVETFDSSFTEAYGYIDLSTLRFSTSLKFSSSVSAGKFRDSFSKSLDELIPSLFKSFELFNGWSQEMIEGKSVDSSKPQSILFHYRLLPVLQELARGNAQLYVPRQNASELLFEMDAATELQKVGPYTIGFNTFMSLLKHFSAKIMEAQEQMEESNPFEEGLFDDPQTPETTSPDAQPEASVEESTTESAPAADKPADAKPADDKASEPVDPKEAPASTPDK